MRALAKFLSLSGRLDKYTKGISTVYKNNTATVKVGDGVSSWFCIESGVKQGCILSLFILVYKIKWERKILPDLDYGNDLSTLVEC